MTDLERGVCTYIHHEKAVCLLLSTGNKTLKELLNGRISFIHSLCPGPPKDKDINLILPLTDFKKYCSIL